mmetsp:Transcript_13183/g.44678  ORF Transcript_13183/g.44678 Transcript_13183/m.44678 type:complete len:418 (+) Transcript_13183:1437-2690(+)
MSETMKCWTGPEGTPRRSGPRTVENRKVPALSPWLIHPTPARVRPWDPSFGHLLLCLLVRLEALEVGRRERQELLQLAHVGAFPEVVVAVHLDPLEDLAVEVKAGAHRHASRRVQLGDAVLRLVEVVPGAGDLELHELDVIFVEEAREDLLLRHAKAVEVLLREVDAPSARVLAHVAEDVGELQGDSKGECRLHGLRVGDALGGAHDGQGHEPHGTRDAVAVHVKVVEGGVAVLAEVHEHALHHVLEWLDVHVGVALHRVHEGQVHDVVGAAVPDVVQPLAPERDLLVQVFEAAARRVDNVVCPPAPGVDGPDGPGPVRVHEARAEVEGFRVARSDLAAHLVPVPEGLHALGRPRVGLHRAQRLDGFRPVVGHLHHRQRRRRRPSACATRVRRHRRPHAARGAREERQACAAREERE